MQKLSFEGSKYSFKRYILTYKSNKFYFILSIPLILLIIILYPLIKIKVGELRSRNIGEFATPAEIYINEIKLKFIKKKKNEIHLFFLNPKISNYYLTKHFRKHLIILPRIILEPIFYFFFINRFFRKLIVPMRYGIDEENRRTFETFTADPNNVLKKSSVTMQFNDEEILFGEKILKNLGYETGQNIVCFANRDGAYKKENSKSRRNAEIHTFKSAIEYLASKNLFNIRMGRIHLKEINFSQKNIYDYSFGNIKSDFMDMFIFSRCSFLITTCHGINALATFFRKKSLIINFEGLDKLHYYKEDFTPFILPKKYKNLENNKYVHFKEVYEKKLFNKPYNELNNNGYDLIDNSEEEILDATKEMYMLLNNESTIDQNTQKNFWEMHESFFKWKPKLITISSSFFKKNKDLFL
tara:strand:+ start:3233 stop:4468 length:1236 start_codon:yes stop_codon:yes gene_type:complete